MIGRGAGTKAELIEVVAQGCKFCLKIKYKYNLYKHNSISLWYTVSTQSPAKKQMFRSSDITDLPRVEFQLLYAAYNHHAKDDLCAFVIESIATKIHFLTIDFQKIN